jgi:hypothetical protein
MGTTTESTPGDEVDFMAVLSDASALYDRYLQVARVAEVAALVSEEVATPDVQVPLTFIYRSLP